MLYDAEYFQIFITLADKIHQFFDLSYLQGRVQTIACLHQYNTNVLDSWKAAADSHMKEVCSTLSSLR